MHARARISWLCQEGPRGPDKAGEARNGQEREAPRDTPVRGPREAQEMPRRCSEKSRIGHENSKEAKERPRKGISEAQQIAGEAKGGSGEAWERAGYLQVYAACST